MAVDFNNSSPYPKKGEQAFDGVPTIAGSLKAQQESAIIWVEIFIKELDLRPLFVLPGQYKDDDKEIPEKSLQLVLDEGKKIIHDYSAPGEDTTFLENWLKKRLQELEQAKKNYLKNTGEYISAFSSHLSTLHFGTETQAVNFASSLEELLWAEAQAPEDLFVKHKVNPEASAPLDPNSSPSAPPVPIPQPKPRIDLPVAQAVSHADPDLAEAEIFRVGHVSESYQPQPGQTGLNRFLELHKIYVKEYGRAPTAEVSKEVKILHKQISAEINTYGHSLERAEASFRGSLPLVSAPPLERSSSLSRQLELKPSWYKHQ